MNVIVSLVGAKYKIQKVKASRHRSGEYIFEEEEKIVKAKLWKWRSVFLYECSKVFMFCQAVGLTAGRTLSENNLEKGKCAYSRSNPAAREYVFSTSPASNQFPSSSSSSSLILYYFRPHPPASLKSLPLCGFCWIDLERKSAQICLPWERLFWESKDF